LIKVEDLIYNLNLEVLYNGSVNPREIGKFLVETKYNTFIDRISRCNSELIEVIIERAVYMYKQGQFNDATKMNYLQTLSPNIKMFK